jgi:electron transfer flavoprotein alpha subunit
MAREKKEQERMTDFRGVMIHCEVVEGELAEISSELLGCGRILAEDLGEELCAVLVGSGMRESVNEAIAFGADKVYTVDDPLLEDYRTDSYVAAMEKVAEQATPQIILMGQTAIGRDLAPSLAFRLETTATMDCVDLAIDPDSKRLLQTKPVYGGNAQAIYTTECNPQIATVRAKAMTAPEPDSSRQGEVIAVDAGIDAQAVRTKVLEKVPEQVEGVKLEAAKVVIGGGRGIGGAEDFLQLEELAGMFGGAVGATRAAVDNGWLPSTKQIGLTGKVITPDLYIAIAISGASQHMAGCYSAGTIVAINKDDGANIFNEAEYGVVGDWREVLPGFLNKLKELR